MDDQRRLIMAKTFKELSQGDEADYWSGYMRGTRRRMHGEKFGTEEEHLKYMGLIKWNELGEPDPSRDAIGRGYRAGLNGIDPIPRRKEEEA
jgi:hypothetical protein